MEPRSDRRAARGLVDPPGRRPRPRRPPHEPFVPRPHGGRLRRLQPHRRGLLHRNELPRQPKGRGRRVPLAVPARGEGRPRRLPSPWVGQRRSGPAPSDDDPGRPHGRPLPDPGEGLANGQRTPELRVPTRHNARPDRRGRTQPSLLPLQDRRQSPLLLLRAMRGPDRPCGRDSPLDVGLEGRGRAVARRGRGLPRAEPVSRGRSRGSSDGSRGDGPLAPIPLAEEPSPDVPQPGELRWRFATLRECGRQDRRRLPRPIQPRPRPRRGDARSDAPAPGCHVRCPVRPSGPLPRHQGEDRGAGLPRSERRSPPWRGGARSSRGGGPCGNGTGDDGRSRRLPQSRAPTRNLRRPRRLRSDDAPF